jgi:hypothetical protein
MTRLLTLVVLGIATVSTPGRGQIEAHPCDRRGGTADIHR